MLKNNKNTYKTIVNVVAIVFFYGFSYGQTTILKGTVVNAKNIPLEYANVFAEPLNKENKIVFALTNNKGSYTLKLQQNKKYYIKVSYLGYTTKEIEFVGKSKEDKYNFTLFESEKKLKEVEIKADLAVSIKKDTITYQVDKFVTGAERKLRDVLKKLPGIEVDKVGNVIAKGKLVTKVLVENKQFFTGNSKLAVNNIPADAVDAVEILDNYNEVAILKELEDTEDVAMNIKLKENKKNFWFGDVELGTGVGFSKRYLIHPSIYYYSPKKAVNVIGDINNIGKKSFTFKDYLEFEGGYSKILLNPKAYFSKMNDDFMKFLNNKDFKNSNHLFGGFSINKSVSSTTDLMSYTIYSKNNNELETQYTNEYITNTNNLIENRIIKNNPKNSFIITKLGLDNTQKNGAKLKVQSFFKASGNKNDYLNKSNVNSVQNIINTFSNNKKINFKQELEWYTQPFDNHTLTAIANFDYLKTQSQANWLSKANVFQNLVPVENDIQYNVFKNTDKNLFNTSILLKHYWELGNFIHLYTTLGNQYYNDIYKTNEYQQKEDKSINSFSKSNFGNYLKFNFNNLHGGFHLKFQIGKMVFKPGVFLHNYYRKTNQFDEELKLNKMCILPQITMNFDFNRSEDLIIRYNKRVRFPHFMQLLKNNTIQGFNSIYKGVPTLENELYHYISVNYYKFNLHKKLNYNFDVSYKKNEKGVKKENILLGIDYLTQPVLLNNSDENIRFLAKVSKGYGNHKFFVKGSSVFINYLQKINTDIFKNKSESYTFEGGVQTNFLKSPNLTVNFKKEFNNYKTQNSTLRFENSFIGMAMEHRFLSNFTLNANYGYQIFSNKQLNVKNQNDLLNVTLFYQKEDSSWNFELSINNVFNNKYVIQSSFSNFLISSNKIFISPQIFSFKVGHKL